MSLECDLGLHELSASEFHRAQRRVSEKAWKANVYRYGYLRKHGKNDNEVSEIQEEPDEDQDENISKILNKYSSPVI